MHTQSEAFLSTVIAMNQCIREWAGKLLSYNIPFYKLIFLELQGKEKTFSFPSKLGNNCVWCKGCLASSLCSPSCLGFQEGKTSSKLSLRDFFFSFPYVVIILGLHLERSFQWEIKLN